MGLDEFRTTTIGEVRRSILAGATLAMETAKSQGMCNADFCAGILAMARYQAMSLGVSWPGVVNDVRSSLGSDMAGLLDGATRAIVQQ